MFHMCPRFNGRSPTITQQWTLQFGTFSMHGYNYLPEVIQSLEDGMEKEEQRKKLMSVRNKLDGFSNVKFEFNLKNNPNGETFATLTEFPTSTYRICFTGVCRCRAEFFYIQESSKLKASVTDCQDIEMLCVIH